MFEEYEYYEPRESDSYSDKVQELIDSIRGDISENIKVKLDDYDLLAKKLEETEKENYKLKSKIQTVESEVEKKKQELERDFKKIKLEDMFKDTYYVAWGVGSRQVAFPKCGYCDDKRQVEVTLPSGAKVKTTCDCNKWVTEYVVVEANLARFAIKTNKDGNPFVYDFRWSNNRLYGELYDIEFRKGTSPKELFDPQNCDTYTSLYTTTEEAQKHVDYLNEKESKRNHNNPVSLKV